MSDITSASTSTSSAGPYWSSVHELGFALPRCGDCGRFHFYPRAACPYCGSTAVAPERASGLGEIYSYSVVYRAPSPAFADQVPYIIAIIATNEGPHLMSRLTGVTPDAVRVGQRVQVRRDSLGLGAPVFEPASEPL